MKSKQSSQQEFDQRQKKESQKGAAKAEEAKQSNANTGAAASEPEAATEANAGTTAAEGADAEILNAQIVSEEQGADSEADESDGGWQQQPDAKDAQIADLTQQLLRTRADFENLRRRTRQEKVDIQQFATKKLLEELLPVVDNFERALSSFTSDETVSQELTSGIEMVHRQFLGVLEQQGVKAMEAVGQPFDPNFHEAVMQEAVEGKEPGEVIAELQKGYTLQDKVLRPAMVKVSG